MESALILNNDWEFDVIKAYNYRKEGHLQDWFTLVKKINEVEGDLIEAGVFTGNSFLGTSLLIQELHATKKLTRQVTNFGFDTFSGFPNIITVHDEWENFKHQLNKEIITKEHYLEVIKNWNYLKFLKNLESPSPTNLSSSGDFSKNSLELLNKKIKLLGLEKSVKIIDGVFTETMNNANIPSKIAGVLFDCDLYSSYKTTLECMWPNLVKGGWFYFDEYYSLKFPGPRTAINEFFADKRQEIEWFYSKRDRDFERHWVIRV